MLRVAAVCTAAATIVVAFYGLGETTAKDWILTGIPAWLQGVGTIGGAYLAIRALRSWKEQEKGKRQAIEAEHLFGLLVELRSKLNSMDFIAAYLGYLTAKDSKIGLEMAREAVSGCISVNDAIAVRLGLIKVFLSDEVDVTLKSIMSKIAPIRMLKFKIEAVNTKDGQEMVTLEEVRKEIVDLRAGGLLRPLRKNWKN